MFNSARAGNPLRRLPACLAGKRSASWGRVLAAAPSAANLPDVGRPDASKRAALRREGRPL